MAEFKKYAVVTGGLGGIGQAIVNLFLQNRFGVIVFDCHSSSDERAKALAEQGVLYYQVDVRCSQQVKRAFTQIPSDIHILVNNAGITRDNLAIRLNEQDWDDVFAVNVKGAFLCSQNAVRRMIRQEIIPNEGVRGYLVNISSIVAHRGNAGQSNYSASKAAIIALTKTLSLEYGKRKIIANVVCPGFINTAMTSAFSDKQKKSIHSFISLNRLGEPEDVARVVYFLSSRQSAYVTGQAINVCGGMY